MVTTELSVGPASSVPPSGGSLTRTCVLPLEHPATQAANASSEERALAPMLREDKGPAPHMRPRIVAAPGSRCSLNIEALCLSDVRDAILIASAAALRASK
jgi:hypothetical protein